MYSKAKSFSHIYVENGLQEHPRAEAILARFPAAEVVPVDDYQNVFGRGRQDFWRQKASPKLILARKKDNFLYRGNPFLQANLSPNFSYNAMVLNCPYDCHYCYLQGLYSGANIVAFVNLEDFFSAAATACDERPAPEEPMPLAISYDTDLLALEGLLGFAGEWVEWVRHQPDILIEIRTKSAPGGFLRSVEPTPAARLAWTLSPDSIARRYESGAPSLKMRLKAMNEAAACGWRMTLCIDPILNLPGAGEIYRQFVEQLAAEAPWPAVERVELGVFRVSSAYFKRMLSRPGTDLLHYPYEHASKVVSYNKKEREDLVDAVQSGLLATISKEKIFIWT